MDPILELKKLGNCFRDRLAGEIIDDALEYIDHSESALAIEILCEQLCEYEVSPTEEEFASLQNLWRTFNLDKDMITNLERYLKP